MFSYIVYFNLHFFLCKQVTVKINARIERQLKRLFNTNTKTETKKQTLNFIFYNLKLNKIVKFTNFYVTKPYLINFELIRL